MIHRLNWRLYCVALAGAVVYLLCLHLSYELLSGSYLPPRWWVDEVAPHWLGVISWFVAINAIGAFAAALPLAVAVRLWGPMRYKFLSLNIGVLAGIFVIGRGITEYGAPTHASAWTVEILQCLCISLAILTLAVLLNRGSKGRSGARAV